MHDKNERFRHELKYQISPVDYYAIRQRLGSVMKLDEHVRADGRYVIRSIYFDNVNDKVLREKINGVQKREKFRIRYYNDDVSYITLEKKIKWNNLCRKIDAKLTKEECRAILAGDTGGMIYHPSGLVRELYCKMKSQQLRPKVLVSYVREPYVYEAGNVRVTFDSNIRSTLFHREFLEETVTDIGVAENPGEMIMEVKFDAFLPEVIQALLQTEGIRQQAYSKYGACRRFG
ncbi:MAG: polyphosphate polymerase domain-containing protein [Lachnospiraceae bacterium]|nr:polyphosphate polymerase domain-containing protein [Lachnospiraceae bacterium]